MNNNDSFVDSTVFFLRLISFQSHSQPPLTHPAFCLRALATARSTRSTLSAVLSRCAPDRSLRRVSNVVRCQRTAHHHNMTGTHQNVTGTPSQRDRDTITTSGHHHNATGTPSKPDRDNATRTSSQHDWTPSKHDRTPSKHDRHTITA